MTSNFWKWLSRANARTALLAAAIAFILAAAYWVWRELDQVEPSAVYSGSIVGAGNGSATNGVMLLAFIKNQQGNGEKAANNPFYKKPVWKPADPQPNPNDGGQPRPQPNPNVKPNPQPRPNPPPPPPPPPKEIPVLYRGIMTRPDGTKAALIENQKTEKQKFFATGETFMNATVEAIAPETVGLRRPDGSTLILSRGQVAKMREE